MNILVTLDEHYLRQLAVMLKSLTVNNPGHIAVYVLSRDLTEKHLHRVREQLKDADLELVLCQVKNPFIKNAPTSSRYPLTIYDRLFAAWYVPDSLDRILYLDPDLIVLRPLDELWNLSFDGNYYAGASHVGKIADFFNSVRIEAGAVVPYVNSGVLLMNLKAIREEQKPQEILDYVSEHGESMVLPDQDVLNGLYGRKIRLLNPYVYNMTERLLTRAALDPHVEIDAKWVSDHSVIVHYIGRNKPWKPHYRGKLGFLYTKYEQMLSDNAHC